ncbi:MAG: tetratricopeptide repeat protein, partial [Thermoplasmata archaeon]
LRAMGRSRLHAYLSGSGAKELGRVEDLLLEDLSQSRSLIVLDDVHVASADARTFLSILHTALKQSGDSSCLLLSRSMIDFYSRKEVDVEHSVAEHTLAGLDQKISESLLARAGIERSLAPRLAEISGGNPLFLRLLGSVGPDEGVDRAWRALETYIAEQIEPNLGGDERNCLQAAALYETPVPTEGLLLEETGGRKTIIGLERKGLIERLDSGDIQTHDFIRSYFRNSLPAERRDSLERKVIRWMVAEAKRREDEHDYEKAIALLENAVLLDDDHKRRLEHLEKLGRLREIVGDFASSIETYRMALEEAANSDTRAGLHHGIARVLLDLHSLEETEDEIVKGLELLPAGPSLKAGRLYAVKAHLDLLRGNEDQALQEVERLAGWMQQLPEDQDLSAYLALLRGMVHMSSDSSRRDPALALDDLRAARDGWRNCGNAQGMVRALRGLGDASVELGEIEQGLRYYDDSVALADELGDTRGRLEALVNKALALDAMGRLDEAEALFEETFHLAKAFHPRYRLLWNYTNLAYGVYYWQGRYEDARKAVDYFLHATGDTDMITGEARVGMLSDMVELCLLCDDQQAAEAHLEMAQDLASRVSSEEATSWVEVAKALLHADRGEHEKAESYFGRALKAESRYRGSTLLHYGRFLAARGETERAKEHLLEARKENESWNYQPFENAVDEALMSLIPENNE